MNNRRPVIIVILATAVGVLITVAVTSVVIAAMKSTQVRDTQTENTPLLQNTAESLKILRGCTTPGEACWERGQKQTAAYIQGLTNDLTRVSAYAAACADKPRQQSTDEIFACVVARLAEADPAPTR